MVSKIFVVLHCIALCSGTYYEPPASVCPTEVEFDMRDVETTVTHLEIEKDGPYTDLDCYIQPTISTSSVTATKFVLSTTTVPLERVTFTKVELEKSAVYITQTEVETVTKILENTDINIVTVTATNYHTDYTTKKYTETVYHETISTKTLTSEIPSTYTVVIPSTFTITQSPIITTEITTEVPYTQAVYETVHGYYGGLTQTHTKTICPKSYYH